VAARPPCRSAVAGDAASAGWQTLASPTSECTCFLCLELGHKLADHSLARRAGLWVTPASVIAIVAVSGSREETMKQPEGAEINGTPSLLHG
jgi:hypothetical protein